MYYDTIQVGPYISFLKKYRILVLTTIFLLGLLAFSSINPNLFSSDERIWLQDSVELERTHNYHLESKHVTKISFHINSFDAKKLEKTKRT